MRHRILPKHVTVIKLFLHVCSCTKSFHAPSLLRITEKRSAFVRLSERLSAFWYSFAQKVVWGTCTTADEHLLPHPNQGPRRAGLDPQSELKCRASLGKSDLSCQTRFFFGPPGVRDKTSSVSPPPNSISKEDDDVSIQQPTNDHLNNICSHSH